jgi:hypothetical protein
MKKISSVVAVILIIGVAGCSSMPDGRGGRKTVLGNPGSPAWYLSTTARERRLYVERICESYGYQKGQSNWPECIQKVMKDLNIRPAP